MNAPDILYTVDGHVARLYFNRPEKLNAFRMQTLKELTRAMRAANKDPVVGVIILSGTGDKAFSAGGDLAEMYDLDKAGGRLFASVLYKAAEAFLKSSKPIIARIDGFCLGGGHDIQLLCDLSIASERSIFGQAGPKYGLAPVWGGPQILPHLVGFKKAAAITFLGRRYSAREALHLGLINEVVAAEKLDETVDGLAEEILAKSPQALRILRQAFFQDFAERFKKDLAQFAKLFGTPELKAGIGAFLERRAPLWNQFRKK